MKSDKHTERRLRSLHTRRKRIRSQQDHGDISELGHEVRKLSRERDRATRILGGYHR